MSEIKRVGADRSLTVPVLGLENLGLSLSIQMLLDNMSGTAVAS